MDLQKVKIVADSSSDTLSIADIAFASAPLKIITDKKEYVDDSKLDVDAMANDLLKYSGKSTTACPSPGDWTNAFGDAEYVFCVTITSSLSGSYNAACIAKQNYEEQFPGRRVFVVDSLSAGPELALIIEKLREYILEGKTFDEICNAILKYKNHTSLLFMLESMRNLANNGRVNPLVAKAAGFLGIRAVGKASAAGTLELLDKCRGEKKALSDIVDQMKKIGNDVLKVRIAHCSNDTAAQTLKNLIVSEFKKAQVEIYRCRGLCSFYAEKGGMLIGFESADALC